MHSSSLTSKGQVTIPHDIRESMGLHPGDKVGFIIDDGHVIIFRKQNNIEAAFGICKAKRTASLKAIEKAIRTQTYRARKNCTAFC